MDRIPLSDLIDEVVDTLMDVDKFFVPVTITRGRKFTGNCYWLNSTEYSGAYGQAMTTANCAWDPKTKKEVWFNGSMDGTPGIVKWQVSDLEKSQALRDYVNHAIDAANKRCGSDDVYRMRWLRKALHIDTDLAQDLSLAIGDKNLDSKWVLYSPRQKIYVLDYKKYPDVKGLTGPDVSKAEVFDDENAAWDGARRHHLTHAAMDWKPIPAPSSVHENTKITLTISQLRRLVKEAAFKDAPELPLDLAITDAVHQLMSKGKDWYVPVTVTKGRKFKGNGYIIGGRQKSNGGYSGSGVRPLQYYIVTQVWDPARGCIDEFNGDLGDPGVDEWNVSDDQKFEDLVGYVKSLINQCVKKCGADYRYRMFYLRKVLGVSTEVAEELANATAELDDIVEVDEEWEYLQRIQRKRDPNRQEFLISYNDTRLDPMDTLYHMSTTVFAKNEREALAALKDEHPEFKVTKITRI